MKGKKENVMDTTLASLSYSYIDLEFFYNFLRQRDPRVVVVVHTFGVVGNVPTDHFRRHHHDGDRCNITDSPYGRH